MNYIQLNSIIKMKTRKMLIKKILNLTNFMPLTIIQMYFVTQKIMKKINHIIAILILIIKII